VIALIWSGSIGYIALVVFTVTLLSFTGDLFFSIVAATDYTWADSVIPSYYFFFLEKG